MKQKWWILLTLLLCGCGASSQPDQTGAVQNDRPRLSASMEETAENVEAVEKNKNLEKNPSNSNQNPGEGQNWTVFAMDTVMQFDAYGGSANLQEKVKRRVEELEGELSKTQENSDIFHLNRGTFSGYALSDAGGAGAGSRNRWCARYFDLPGCAKLGIYNGKLPGPQ